MRTHNDERRQKIREVLRHPVAWYKGVNEAEETVHPWEMGLHVLSEAGAGLRNGFSWNIMSLFQNVFKVSKNQQSVASVASGVWDGFNDPIIGAYMDSKAFKTDTHRKVMRVNALVGGLLTGLLFFDFGMTAWQHVILYIVINVIKSVFNTASTVSSAKVWAHITPYSQERSKIAAANAFGVTLREALGGMIWVILGLREVLGWSEYQIYLIGGVLTTLPALFTDMMPSFVHQRVPDMEEASAEKINFFKELKESFAIVRHNKYFVLKTLASFLTTFTPSVGDNDFYRYSGITETLNTGKIRGEMVMWLRSNVAAAPGMFVQPFSLSIMKKLGGPRRTMILYQAVLAVCGIARWAVGVKNIGGYIFLVVTEMICWTFGKVDAVADRVIQYDMLDYVEWKTGRRSEGVTMAVGGIVQKIAINQFDTVIGNLFLQRVGFNAELGDKGQPASYLKWATRLYLLCPGLDAAITLIFRILYRYSDEQRAEVEAALIARRALAAEAETVQEES